MTTSTSLPFGSEHKTKNAMDMDRLKFTDKGEKSRVMLLDKNATYMLRHFVSNPVRVEGEGKGRYYACLGDYDTVMESQIDGKNCPACAVAQPGMDQAVSTARRQFAIHVALYHTNGKGERINPLSVQLQVWVFGDDKFNKLVDRQQEHGDLRKKDLIITCTAVKFMNLDIDVGADVWLTTDKAAFAQYHELKAQKSGELDRILGMRISYEALETAANLAVGAGTPTSEAREAVTAEAVASVAAELDETPLELDLDDEDPTSEGEKVAVQKADNEGTAPVAVADEPAAEEAPEGELSLESLLDD